MEASVKKYRKYLVQSKTLPTFVVRDSDDQVAKNIFYTADRRVPVILPFRWSLSRKQKGARLLFVYTQLTFDLKCETAKKLAQVHQVYPMLRLTPVTALNPFYPFLTKKSFFAFNPLHRTNCVISSRYFVQPCMSLQCDNQNGCMKTVFRNISEKCLQSQKGFASLLLPRAHYIVVSKNIFQKSCNKASLSCGTSLTGSEFLAELQGRLALSVLDITQNFIPCQELMKLAQAHKVRPMLRLTPVTALNPFYPFLTKKSFFVFNPLHRTSCVLSSRYFVQPCMSLQCDDQNGCMKTVFRNISVRMFAVSNEITMFAMRQTHRTARRSDGITYSADKAGLISGISSGNSRCGFVAELGNSSAYSLYTYQIFRPCDKPRRICSKTYQIRPEHAIAVRKQLNLSYPFLTRKSSIVSNLFQRVRSAISLRCSVSFSVCS